MARIQVPRILVVDDEPQIRKFLRISLSANGYEVVEAENGRDGIGACAERRPDLVILDLGLPDLDGQEVISAIHRTAPVPIIVLSVRAQEYDKVEALDRGAVDYVVKPFGVGELMARVRAVLRQRPADAEPPTSVTAGTLVIDLARRIVERGGAEVHLSRKEYELLAMLARHADHVLTHADLLREVWGPAHVHDTAYLRVYVKQLRQKLEDDPNLPVLIVTEPGVGYRFRTGTE
ncbi:two-component system, OmpR family, KDP operon response regulator (plasmid) [Azospirillum sp. B510]|uniref:response regulator n=1 Tax=Azospirillum sp. (strain B510) TaxID=137722 RepID=UPI0001C4CD0D|nr:response regulator transcription factor [Azospirillum sp. B510]BAI74932.1 two-component system, OmpR family, KDP operon response regulator [Azospirillum sp. B510]